MILILWFYTKIGRSDAVGLEECDVTFGELNNLQEKAYHSLKAYRSYDFGNGSNWGNAQSWLTGNNAWKEDKYD